MAGGYQLKGSIALVRDRHDEALAFSGRAAELAPCDAWALGSLGLKRLYAGLDKDATVTLSAAMRLTPIRHAWLVCYRMIADMWLGDFASATAAAEAYEEQEPDEPYGFAYQAALMEMVGRHAAAAAAISRLKARAPTFGLANIKRSERYRDAARLDILIGLMRKAGLE